MSNKNARCLQRKGVTLKKTSKRPYGCTNPIMIAASHDYGHMRDYGIACLNKRARVSKIKDYANLYVGGVLRRAAYGQS